jgi:hypothetical protein
MPMKQGKGSGKGSGGTAKKGFRPGGKAMPKGSKGRKKKM